MIILKNKFLITFIVIAILISVATYFYINNKDNNSNYDTTKTSTNNTIVSESNINNNNINIEEEISSFSTKIYSTDPARQNNISITCNLLNNVIVENDQIFSFCDTVGKATTKKGYQEADIFDKEGNKIKGLGGRKLSN